MFKANKVDDLCNDIREIIINDKEKLKNIIFDKCVIMNEVLFHKNRL